MLLRGVLGDLQRISDDSNILPTRFPLQAIPHGMEKKSDNRPDIRCLLTKLQPT